MESRKRHRTDDGEVVQAKKRALSASHDSPIAVNGDADEPKDNDSLETFRKDAIYRRMKHYARENERGQARITELEQRRNTCEAGLAALEACWAQLIGTIRSLATSEQLPAVEVDTRDVFDLTKHVTTDPDPSDYIEELRTRMHATEQLVAAFVRVGGEARSQLLHDNSHRRCLEAQTECASLHAEVSLLSTRLRHVELEKEKYHEQLIVAERRIDRLQSKMVLALNPSSHPPGEDTHILKDESNETVKARSAEPVTISHDSPSASADAVMNGDTPLDTEDYEAIASLREEKYALLLAENSELQANLYKAQASAKTASEAQITSTSSWKSLSTYTTRLIQIATDDRKEVAALQKEIEMLRKMKERAEVEHSASLERAKSELQDVISKKELEILRLREQRDAREVELKERKTRESSRIQLASQYKQLADAREERITALQSEVGRLKARLASQTDDEDLMTFFFKTNEDVTYINDLRSRLEKAETRLMAFENTDVGEVERKERLFKATKQLERYKSMFGETSTLPPDSKAMAEQLKRKDADLQSLRLQQKQQEEAEASMYTELERLSSAWEVLDRELKNKIHDLSAVDEQLKKLTAEKAKAENKYFKVMADKAAIEQQNIPYQRKIEKQAKVLEKLSEAERISNSRVKDLEKALMQAEQLYGDAKARQDNGAYELQQYRARYEDTRKRLDEFNHTIEKAMEEVNKKKQDLLKQEEALVKKNRDLQKQAVKAKATTSSHNPNASVREAELQGEVDKCMSILKCSTCRMNMRNTVLTKCMHSFCKNCVNERIQSRQRKCPACNLPFSQGEVQQLYFQ